MTLADDLSIATILQEIEKLESKSDPKCYATASRLEDFMFGTPLSDEARFSKNDLQKQLAKLIWQKAAQINQQGLVQTQHIQQAIASSLQYQKNQAGHWQLTFASQQALTLHETDVRQYDSIAYALRAILAVQQEQLISSAAPLPMLAPDAVNYLKQIVNLYTLAVLKVSDNQARLNNQYQVNAANLKANWFGLNKPMFAQLATASSAAKASADLNTNANPTPNPIVSTQPTDLRLFKQIIQQKVNAYKAYNNISNQLFFRNLQVYFARVSWPADAEEGKQFRSTFTEILIAFAGDLFKQSQAIALQDKHVVIEESDVNAAAQAFMPHEVNEYEDVIFFPRLAEQKITIESYDMDAFRDSGIHWRYFEFAINEPNFKPLLEPNPFAAELLAENVAQFGVLLLRVAGLNAIANDRDRLRLADLKVAVAQINQKINAHQQALPIDQQQLAIHSSDQASEYKDVLFSDVSHELGIKMEHRSSDWLNRLLRSYLPKGDGVGTITVPPAFGGAGVAAGDINNDGLQDVLVLSGAGNRLYVNSQQGFKDISQSSGLANWRRADNNPGEPRQPLIADIDNDGWQDIVITYVNDTHRVYRNLGNNRFEDKTEVSQLGGQALVGGPATVFDYDNDGLLDIYITYFGNYLRGELPTLKRRNTNGLPNKLFKNMGGFRFKDVTANSGLDNRGWGQAVTHTDLNQDGWQDLIVGNDFGINSYYINQGNGQFIDVASQLGTDKPSYTMNIGLTDLNGDFQPDIYISNIVTMNKDEKYVLPNEDTRMKFNPEKLANMRVVEANDLFISAKGKDNLPRYSLSELVGRGYSSTGWSWDADFFDFDNDADDDLYVLNGMNEFNLYSSKNPYYTDPLSNKQKDIVMPVSFKERNVFFINQGGRLVNASKQSGTDLLSNSRSAVYFDYDLDGDLDILVNNYHEASVLLRNNSQNLNNNWLKVKLLGSPQDKVNLDAIGARIELITDNNDKIWREVHGSIGYMSVHPKTQHFGLGKAKQASLRIIWPNGQVQTQQHIKANQIVTIKYAPKN
ncbi:CRTAC1 family protein [Saccharobesus litoralis]|nr:CRTAC1 family protein [Saccharobesus litoralis]